MGIPLPALSIRPPENPMEQVGQALQLKSLLGQQQLQQGQIQAQQAELKSRKAITDAFIKHQGIVDDDMISDAAKGGAAPDALQSLQQHRLQMANLLNTKNEGDLKLLSAQHEAIGKEAQAALALPQNERLAATQRGIIKLTKAGVIPQDQAQQEFQQVFNASPEELDSYLKVHALGAMSTKDQIEAALNERKTAAMESEAAIKAQSFAAEQPGGTKENPEQKYIRLQAKKEQGQALSEADAAWLKGYAKNAGLRQVIGFNLQAQGMPASPAAQQGKTGQAYLSSLPIQRQSIVKGITEGRIPMPSSFALKTPYWQSVMNDVMQYDPEFSTQRADLRKGFITGKQSTEINAINTALGHVGALGDAVDALKNGNVQVLNKVANAYGVQVGQTPATTLQLITNRVGPELVKAYSGTAGSESERQQFEKDFSASMSPDQLRTNVSKTVELLRSKISALENQWDQNKAPDSPSFQDKFIMPAAKRIVDKYSTEGKSSMIFARDQQGKLHQAPAGTALPPGWKLENK